MEEIYLSVSDVNTYIKSVFDRDEFLSFVNIKGEISNLKFHTRGHLYFSLKDENSKINAVMFNYKDANLSFIPKDGMNVEVRGKINVFVAGGSYQVNVTSMKEDGVGNLYILFEELKRNLANEGLFDESKKKKLPRIPKKVGVITASTGAAVKDIISTINRRFPLTEIILFPTLVQGEGAKENIVRMLEKANQSDVDVIIVGRGGGSIEDLWAFNEEIVVRAIYASVKPVVSAVGHEIDYTISDFVSDMRAPTPTAAAELVVPSQLEIQRYLSDYKSRIISVMTKKLASYTEFLDKCRNSYVLNNPVNMYRQEEQKLDNLIEMLNINVLHRLDRENSLLENLKTKLELLNPDNILSKGYSVTLVNGKILRSVKDLKVSDEVTTRVSDGEFVSEVKEVI
jgi:exodeoxyribonuclease VII large subunit